MSSILDKVRKLITLAVNHGATEAEGRTAAMQAVKLIHENKLLNGGHAPHDENTELQLLRARVQILQSAIRGAQMHDAMLKNQIAVLERKVRDLEQQARMYPSGRPNPNPSPAMPRNRDVSVDPAQPSRPDRMQPRKIIRSQFSGTCRRCKEPIEIGNQIAWATGRGALCMHCYDAEREECR